MTASAANDLPEGRAPLTNTDPIVIRAKASEEELLGRPVTELRMILAR